MELTPSDILEQLKAINEKLVEIKSNQTSLDQKINDLQTDVHYIIAKQASNGGEIINGYFKPYYDVETMLNYCRYTGRHPADLTKEERDRFKINRDE